MCLYRFKIWWMIPRWGKSGKDIPFETQMLPLEARQGADSQLSKEDNSYILFLPVLDGEFRSSLQGNSSNELELCVESGKNFSIFKCFPFSRILSVQASDLQFKEVGE